MNSFSFNLKLSFLTKNVSLFDYIILMQVRKAIKQSRIKRKKRKRTAPAIPKIVVKPCVIYQKNGKSRV